MKRTLWCGALFLAVLAMLLPVIGSGNNLIGQPAPASISWPRMALHCLRRPLAQSCESSPWMAHRCPPLLPEKPPEVWPHRVALSPEAQSLRLGLRFLYSSTNLWANESFIYWAITLC